MTASLDVDVLGVRVRIDIGDDVDDAQLEQLRHAWSGALSTADATSELTVPFSAGDDFERAMERLTVQVTLAGLDARRGRALLFHAAGIADDAGRVAAFVGPSGRGKTTLSRELGTQWGYVSDETIAVDADLRVAPYRKPLSVVRRGGPKRQVAPRDFQLLDLPAADLRLAALVLIDRDAELEEPIVDMIPLAEALPQLVPQMSYLRDHDRPLQTVAALSDAVGGIHHVSYPDSSMVPAVVPQLLRTSGSASPWSPAPAQVASGPYSIDVVDDAILSDGRVIALARATVHVLDGIAPVIWTACARGEELDGIVADVVERFGAPPEHSAGDLVEQAIEELIAAGVLRRR